LAGSEADDRLDRLAEHPVLGGPELTFFQAQLAEQRGNSGAARGLVEECLQKLPGNLEFAGFALHVGAKLPALTQRRLDEQARIQRLISAPSEMA
jgi:hypothetical protein